VWREGREGRRILSGERGTRTAWTPFAALNSPAGRDLARVCARASLRCNFISAHARIQSRHDFPFEIERISKVGLPHPYQSEGSAVFESRGTPPSREGFLVRGIPRRPKRALNARPFVQNLSFPFFPSPLLFLFLLFFFSLSRRELGALRARSGIWTRVCRSVRRDAYIRIVERS